MESCIGCIGAYGLPAKAVSFSLKSSVDHPEL